MRSRIVAKMAGGARMFDVPGSGNLGNIGQRNIESAHLVLRREGVRLLREDVGGTTAARCCLTRRRGRPACAAMASRADFLTDTAGKDHNRKLG